MTQYVVEARDSDGQLVTDRDKQPPWAVASEAQLFRHYEEQAEADACFTWAAMERWMNNKGWFIRAKHW